VAPAARPALLAPRLIGALLLAAVPILVIVYTAIDPLGPGGRFLPKCVFHQATDLYCPGCGTQRALHSLLIGDPLAAVRYNPLAILLAPLLLFYGVPILYSMIKYNEYRELRMPSWLVTGLAVTVIAYFILRNLSWLPFLAPG
jgi:hypothetical protein